MTEQTAIGDGIVENASKIDLYRDSNYLSLYRYENPNVSYIEDNEELVTKRDLVGSWFVDNLEDLEAYVITRVRGQRGGRFVIVRVKKDELDRYDVTKLPETKDMDIDHGEFLIPSDIRKRSGVEIDGFFKDSWEGKKTIQLTDYAEIRNYIEKNLSDEAIIARLEKSLM